ncbi:MAG: T9SS type A sorting domain-containing protein [Flavobacteriaceae bacterium]
MKKFFTSFFFVIYCYMVNSQTPTEFLSFNVQVNDIGSYGNTMIINTISPFFTLDLSVGVTSLVEHTNLSDHQRKSTVIGDYLYYTSGASIKRVDLSVEPLVRETVWTDPQGGASFTAIDVKGNDVYISRNSVIYKMDISQQNPTPIHYITLSHTMTDFNFFEDKLYYSREYGGKIGYIDTASQNPVAVELPWDMDDQFAIEGSTLYYSYNGNLYSLDLSNPGSNPVQIATVPVDTPIQAMEVVDNDLYFYQQWNNKTISVLDLSTLSTNNYELGNMLMAYPNPASNRVTFEVNNEVTRIISVKIRDVEGREVVNKFVDHGTKSMNLDLSKLSQGIYVAEITFHNGSRKQQKIIKQ